MSETVSFTHCNCYQRVRCLDVRVRSLTSSVSKLPLKKSVVVLPNCPPSGQCACNPRILTGLTQYSLS